MPNKWPDVHGLSSHTPIDLTGSGYFDSPHGNAMARQTTTSTSNERRDVHCLSPNSPIDLMLSGSLNIAQDDSTSKPNVKLAFSTMTKVEAPGSLPAKYLDRETPTNERDPAYVRDGEMESRIERETIAKKERRRVELIRAHEQERDMSIKREFEMQIRWNENKHNRKRAINYEMTAAYANRGQIWAQLKSGKTWCNGTVWYD